MTLKYRIRNTLITLIAWSGLVAIYRWRVRRRGPLVRVLCFHDVPDRQWFEAVIELLVSEYALITPGQFHNNQFVADKINILLTFDDGYQSWIDVCLPVMKKYDVKGIFFINSGLLDCAGDEDAVAAYMREKLLLQNIRKPMTWEGARALVAAGHNIGGHTINHVRLSQVDEVTAHREIADDKARLESILNITIGDFAFPFGGVGDYNQELSKLSHRSDYKFIYSAIAGFTEFGADVVPRLLLEVSESLSRVKIWSRGGYDIYSKFKILLMRC